MIIRLRPHLGAIPYTMVVGGDRKYKVFVVSFLYLKISKLIVGTIQRFISMYLPYFIQITVTLLLSEYFHNSFSITNLRI